MRRRNSILTALSAVIIGVVVAGVATLVSSPNDSKAASRHGPVAVADTHSILADQVVDLVNEQRARAGCPPLIVDSRLVQAAEAHSVDMAERRYFDHTTPEGVSFHDRIENAGYSNPITGENLAQFLRTAKSVVAKWMRSPEHRVNILNCAYSRTGVGLADNGIMFWTQDFGTV